jgi:hypothetical protein
VIVLKPFLKSPLPIVSIVLITFTVLAVTTVFLSATSLVTNIGINIGRMIKWELAGSKYSSYGSPRIILEPESLPEEYVSVNEGFEISKEVAERLSSDSRISDYIVIQIILIKSPERSLIPLMELSIIVLHGIKLSDLGVSQDAAIDGSITNYLNNTLINLLLGGLNYTTYSEDLSKLLEGLRGIPCLEFYEERFYRTCVVYNPLSLFKASTLFVIDSSTFEKVGLSHLNKVKDRFKALNVSVDFYTMNVLVFVDLRSESYFNPASIQGSLENAKAIAEDLKNSLDFESFSNTPLRSVLSNYQFIETAFRVSSVAGVLPAFVALVAVLRPISEMLVLSVRRAFGLMRIRGVSQSVVRRWFYGILLISLIAGFGLGLLVSYVLAVSYFKIYDPLQVLLDPIILSMLAILLAIEVLILARRISRTSSSISPAETLKTTLIPESLLEPVRMSTSGWFSVGVGLYFIITGITNYSATRILTTGMVGGPSNVNIALIIVLAIVAMFESLLKPFAPAIAVYGFIKLYIVNHERFWDILHRSMLSRSSLALPSKSIALTIRRRVTPILVLLAFSTSVMTQTLIYGESMNSLVDSAIKASAGSDFLLSKSLSIVLTPNKTLREVLNEYSDTQKVLNGWESIDNSSSILAFEVYGSVRGTSMHYCCLLTLIVVPDPNTFLRNTYWYDEWSLRGSFSESLNEVLSEGRVVLVRDSASFTIPAGSDLKDLSVYLTASPQQDVMLVPEVVDVWSGFPGIPGISPRAFAIVAGSWVLDVPNFTKVLYTVPFMGGDERFTAHVYVYSLSSSVSEELINGGFTVVKSLKDLRSDPEVEIVRSLLTSTGGSSETYLIFMILSAGIAAVVAYVVALETGRTALLLRVRGLTPSKTLKLNALYWLTVTATSVLLGSVVGLALGLSDLNAYGTSGGLGASLTYMFSYLLGLKGLQLSLGVLRVAIPPVLILTTLLAFVLLSLIPITTIQLVYRGQVRERFIEVR